MGGDGVGWGWVLIRGWALINFFCLNDGRLFEVGANSRLGAYSNKYGIIFTVFSNRQDPKAKHRFHFLLCRNKKLRHSFSVSISQYVYNSKDFCIVFSANVVLS